MKSLCFHIFINAAAAYHKGHCKPSTPFTKELHFQEALALQSFFFFFKKKMGQPRPLIHLFSSFQTNITNFTTNMYVKKCPSSIRCWDSNSRPLEHEPPPITTRPGLPPVKIFFNQSFNHDIFFFISVYSTVSST